MAFLFTPKKAAFEDETLESYMLRIAKENFFDSYEQLSLAIREALLELDHEAHGAFPIELKLLNIYHAKQNSHFRVRALALVESLLNIPKFTLLKLSYLKSNTLFLNSYSSVYRNGVDIPLLFLRQKEQRFGIPICPHCLQENQYIRYFWGIKPYTVCAIHNVKLIKNCPDCNQLINYIENQSIGNCSCGYDLSKAPTSIPSSEEYKLAIFMMEQKQVPNAVLFNNKPLSHYFASLIWFQHRYQVFDSFNYMDLLNYFNSWPDSFHGELHKISSSAETLLIIPFNQTSFHFIFGDLILRAEAINTYDHKKHFIHEALIDYLCQLVNNHQKSTKPNIADILLSVTETAIILSTSNEQVYRLFEHGILQAAFNLKIQKRINANEGIFFLRQVIEFYQSYGCSGSGVYVSKW